MKKRDLIFILPVVMLIFTGCATTPEKSSERAVLRAEVEEARSPQSRLDRGGC